MTDDTSQAESSAEEKKNLNRQRGILKSHPACAGTRIFFALSFRFCQI
jgi:hypothetical protein